MWRSGLRSGIVTAVAWVSIVAQFQSLVGNFHMPQAWPKKKRKIIQVIGRTQLTAVTHGVEERQRGGD